MTPQTPQNHSLTNWALLAFLGVIWGASFPSVSVALKGFSPLWVATIRIVLAAIILVFLALVTGKGLPPTKTAAGRRIWLHCLGMAIFSNALPFALLSWGQQYVTAGFAGITMAIAPLMVLPLAHFLIAGEQMTARRSFGFAVGFVGVGVLIGPAAFARSGAYLETVARFACVSAPLCYAIGSIITRLAPPSHQLSFGAAAVSLAALIMLPLAFLSEGLPVAPPLNAILAVGYLGLIPTALATIILVKIINQEGPGFLSLVNYQVPVWAALMGVVFLSETLPARFIVALAIILVGLFISQARGWQRFRP